MSDDNICLSQRRMSMKTVTNGWEVVTSHWQASVAQRCRRFVARGRPPGDFDRTGLLLAKTVDRHICQPSHTPEDSRVMLHITFDSYVARSLHKTVACACDLESMTDLQVLQLDSISPWTPLACGQLTQRMKPIPVQVHISTTNH